MATVTPNQPTAVKKNPPGNLLKFDLMTRAVRLRTAATVKTVQKNARISTTKKTIILKRPHLKK